MVFSFDGYSNLLDLLRTSRYSFCSYRDWEEKKRCVILRHDIDYSPVKALEMAELERKKGVCSTYFVLITSDFYNVFSKQTSTILKSIALCGHDIGLHFDEVRYPGLSTDVIQQKIIDEAKLLGQAIEMQVTTVSMHRPSKAILEADLHIPGIINSYGSKFFKGFKYLSDSRRRWREPIEEIIESEQYDRLHILTHAFWYERREIGIHDSVRFFVNKANIERYEAMADNITDLSSIMERNEVLYE